MARYSCSRRELMDADLWRWGAWASDSARALGYSPFSITASTGGRSGKVSDPTAKAAEKMHWLHRLHGHIMQLERPWRRVVVLHYLKTMPLEDVAFAMNLPVNRVKYRLQDIQDLLADKRRERHAEPGEIAAILSRPEVERLLRELALERAERREEDLAEAS